MRILYHHRTQAEDAQGIHIYEMVKAFRNLGHEVEMVALVKMDEHSGKNIGGSSWGWLTRYSPNWFHEFMSLAYNLYGYRRLCQTIRSKHPDLIYERYALNTFCGILASRYFNIPLVLEVNAPLYYEQRKLAKLTFKRLARFSERWICSHSTWTVPVSSAMKKILMEEGVLEEKLFVMHNGVDPQKFHPTVCGETVRRRYGLDGKLVIGFVGWFRPWHGLEMLLEVAHEAGLAAKDVMLLLVGDGPAYASLYNYAKKNSILSSVIFTGPISRQEIPAHIAAMDITIQPSAPEYACPMKIIEYMGMGKCIIAPDQPNIREILEDRMTGFLFRDRTNLASTILELLDDPVKREVTGRKAHESIFERGFLWDRNAQRILTLVFGKKYTVPTIHDESKTRAAT